MFTKLLVLIRTVSLMAEQKKPEEEGEDKKGVLDKFVSGLKEALSEKPEEGGQVLSSLNLEGVAALIKEGKVQNIIVMTGAGVSTSAGIPDFRSPGSGLYSNLGKYNLPHPQAIFEIGFFLKKPEPFFELAKELYPGKFKPTPCHYLIRLLEQKGLLLRVFTQNIDTLDHVAGISADKIVEAHGSFYTGHCLGCKKEYTLEWMKEKIFADEVPRCDCESVVKPDIVFFGESLPQRFFTRATKDFPNCDLLIIMGTSLVIQPFAGLVGRVGPNVPRLLINNQRAGNRDLMERLLGLPGLDFDSEDNTRDVFWEGLCDDGVLKLAELIGWEKDLKSLIDEEWAKIDSQSDQKTSESKV